MFPALAMMIYISDLSYLVSGLVWIWHLESIEKHLKKRDGFIKYQQTKFLQHDFHAGKVVKFKILAAPRICIDTNPPVMKHYRQHTHPNDKDYVGMPKINLMEQVVSRISITGDYEANATALKTAKNMAQKALEMGR